MCLKTIKKYSDTKSCVEELLKYHNKLDLFNELKDWKIPKFPVSGSVLKENVDPTVDGRTLGVIMRKLKDVWEEKEFQPTSEELLKYLPEILEEVSVEDGKVIKKTKFH